MEKDKIRALPLKLKDVTTLPDGMLVSVSVMSFTEDTDLEKMYAFLEKDMKQRLQGQRPSLERFVNNFASIVGEPEIAAIKYTLRDGKLVMVLPTNWGYTVEISVREEVSNG